jgi:hypothetical protein
MALLDRPGQPQRYSLLAPDVMNLIQSGGPRVAPAPVAPAQPDRRGQPGFLTYLLGGSEGLDAERARRQAEAERPQMLARQAEVLASIADPRERALFLGMGGEDWQKNVGQQFAPQVIAAGGIQSVIGNNQRVGAPQTREFGDRIAITDPLTGETRYTDPRPMTPAERTAETVAQTGRINALNVPVGPNTDLVNPVSGQAIYQGFRAPDIQNVAPGGEALVFDENGNVINRVGSTQVRPPSDADQTAIARADNQIVSLDTSLARAAAIEGQIARGELNLGVLENTGSGLRNLAGMSDQNSLNYDALLAWAKEARNAILQANTGVQTDQDAIRELDTILSSTRDERIVTAALRRFQEARSATRAALQRDIQRRQGGAAPVSGGGQAVPAAPASSGVEDVVNPRTGERLRWNGSAWVRAQ